MAQGHLARFATLRLLLVAGEAMPPRDAVRTAKRFPRLLVVNGYGPTENNYTTEYRVRARDAEDAPVPIGTPIDNTTVYLLDTAQRLVPPGIVGELCTGGDGLALGYVGRTDLTAERFASPCGCPTGDASACIRTGDLARHRADGVLEVPRPRRRAGEAARESRRARGGRADDRDRDRRARGGGGGRRRGGGGAVAGRARRRAPCAW